jgi:hypothetical protein
MYAALTLHNTPCFKTGDKEVCTNSSDHRQTGGEKEVLVEVEEVWVAV